MIDRIRRPKKHKELMDSLRETGTFETLKDIIVFAASLGLSKESKIPFSETAEAIPLQYFRGEYDQVVINTIAIKDTDDPFIMSDERTEERIRIFEEYANGGLECINNNILSSKHLSKEEVLIDMVLAEQKDGKILDEITALADL